jgi:inosine/xanthosine triphosphatase
LRDARPPSFSKIMNEVQYIFVGSTNPVKTKAVSAAIYAQWPQAEVQGFETESGVSSQPMDDEETRKGSLNRSKSALIQGQKWLKEAGRETDQILGIGLEGGVFVTANGELWSTVWIVVTDLQGNQTSANGARFKVPEIIAQKIRFGGEMGPVVSELVEKADIRKKEGMIGIITSGFVNRTEEYTGITKLAIGLWYGRDWQKQIKTSKQ